MISIVVKYAPWLFTSSLKINERSNQYCFTKKCDCESYLEAKHENFKLQCEEEKKSYCENEIHA